MPSGTDNDFWLQKECNEGERRKKYSHFYIISLGKVLSLHKNGIADRYTYTCLVFACVKFEVCFSTPIGNDFHEWWLRWRSSSGDHTWKLLDCNLLGWYMTFSRTSCLVVLFVKHINKGTQLLIFQAHQCPMALQMPYILNYWLLS